MLDVQFPSPFEAYLGDQPYIFVAYARADAVRVYQILKLLNDRGYRFWYDEGIEPGNEWTEDVAHRLTSCAAFIVFISPQAVQSKNVRNEINFVLRCQVPFLAVHIEQTELPPGLQLQIGSTQAILQYLMNSDKFTRKLLASLDPSLVDSKRNLAAGIRLESYYQPVTFVEQIPSERTSRITPRRMTEVDVQKLAEEAMRASEARANEVVKVLIEIADNEHDEIAQEAVFRLGCIGLPEALPCLYRIADDAFRSWNIRERAMIDLCRILRHEHPSGTFASMGEWLKWWKKSRNEILFLINK